MGSDVFFKPKFETFENVKVCCAAHVWIFKSQLTHPMLLIELLIGQLLSKTALKKKKKTTIYA